MTAIQTFSRAAALAVAALAAWPAAAQERPALDALLETMRAGELAEILHDEGVAAGLELGAEMLPGGGGASWPPVLARIYDADAMLGRFEGAMAEHLTEAQAAEIEGWMGAPLGRRITELELTARRAYADPDIEAAAEARWREREGAPKTEAIAAFAEANDLMEENVAAALTGNFEFLQGMNDGGGFPEPMSEDRMLSQTWAAEGEIRDSTAEWIGGFLGLAYDPLTVDEIDAYTEFSQTEAGRAFNAALFRAFDAMYNGVSYDFGRAVAARVGAQEL